MKPLKALITDDEDKAVQLLQKLLEDTGSFDEIRWARSAGEAARELRHFSPDVIFLDIKMPGKDGITLLKELRSQEGHAEVVFVTAYDEYAIQAVKNSAFDYLLKPVDRKELAECIERLRRGGGTREVVRHIQQLVRSQEPPRLRINTRTGYVLIDPSTIYYCKADGNYTQIETEDQSHLCSLQLGVLGKRLSASDFSRLGRSLILCLRHVRMVDRKEGMVVFGSDTEMKRLALTRSQLRELDSRMQ
jgi:two-component system LytT family response regulator